MLLGVRIRSRASRSQWDAKSEPKLLLQMMIGIFKEICCSYDSALAFVSISIPVRDLATSENAGSVIGGRCLHKPPSAKQ